MSILNATQVAYCLGDTADEVVYSLAADLSPNPDVLLYVLIIVATSFRLMVVLIFVHSISLGRHKSKQYIFFVTFL